MNATEPQDLDMLGSEPLPDMSDIDLMNTASGGGTSVQTDTTMPLIDDMQQEINRHTHEFAEETLKG